MSISRRCDFCGGSCDGKREYHSMKMTLERNVYLGDDGTDHRMDAYDICETCSHLISVIFRMIKESFKEIPNKKAAVDLAYRRAACKIRSSMQTRRRKTKKEKHRG